MKEKLTRNIGVKILSLLLAAFLWIVITNVDDPIQTVKFRKDVEILNEDEILSPNQGYEIEQGKTSEFTVSARKSIADNLTKEDFRVTADFALLSDVYATEIKIEPIRYKDDIVISESSKNNMMKITLQQMMTKNFKVKLDTNGDITKGYAVGEFSSSPNIISVSGPKSRVESIDQVFVSADVSDAIETITALDRPKAYDKDGNEVDSSKLIFSVNYITVNLEIYKTKKIPLKVEQKGAAAYGYSITDIEYEPKEIEISGKDSDLLKTNKVVIEVDVDGISEIVEKDINIKDYLPDGINLVDEDEVMGIKITVEKMETKEVSILPKNIEIKNLITNLNVNMHNVGEMTVKVMGTPQVLKEISEKELSPYIDLSEYSRVGTYTTSVKFDPVDGVEIISKPVLSFSLLPSL